jgi:SAM-dependent methyltransferase
MHDHSFDPIPERSRQITQGWFSAQVMKAALELGVFDELGKGPRTVVQLQRALALRAGFGGDFLDTLVALGLLDREGDDEHAVYLNSRESAFFLDRNSTSYLRGLPFLADTQNAARWAGLAGALRGSAKAQPRAPKHEAAAAAALCDEISVDLLAERCVQIGLPSAGCVLDAGSGGRLALALVGRMPRLRGVALHANSAMSDSRQASNAAVFDDRVQWFEGELEPQPRPAADAIVLTRLLQPLGIEQRRALVRRAHQALVPGGWLLVADLLVDDARRTHVTALQAALDGRLGGAAGGSLSAAEVERECLGCGYTKTDRLSLDGVASAVVAYR